MYLELDATETALRDAVRELARRELAPRMRDGLSDRSWQLLADAGVFDLLTDAETGPTHAAVVCEELGRVLAAGPVVDTIAARPLVPDARRVAVLDRRQHPPMLEHPDAVDLVLLLGEDVAAVTPDALTLRPLPRPLDPLTPVARILGPLPEGTPVGGGDAAAALRRSRAVLAAAVLVGIAAETTERAAGYALHRQQFGRPIGAFQAIKHLCADMLVRTEVARSAVYAAACHLADSDLPDVDRAVATAALLAAEAGIRNGEDCVQVHGGFGFTWEADVHLFVKRAAVLAASLGSPTDHERVLLAEEDA